MPLIKNRNGQYIKLKNYTKFIRTSFVIYLQINTERMTIGGHEITLGDSIDYFNLTMNGEEATVNNETINLK